MNTPQNVPTIGTPDAKVAALQALGKRIIEERSLYFPSGKPNEQGTASPPSSGPKKQKIDNGKGLDRSKDDIPTGQRDGPYLSYEQYENLLYRGKQTPSQTLQQQQSISKSSDTLENSIPNEHIPIDSLISDLPYDDANTSNLNSSIDNSLNTSVNNINQSMNTSMPSSLSASLNNALSHALNAGLNTSMAASMSNLSPSINSLTPTLNATISSQPNQLALIPSGNVLSHSHGTSSNTAAHAVALLNSAESQKIQRKKANQQEREILEKYYNDHYIDQAVKIRKEDLTELAYQLNWHVLRVQGWMHTHRQSRSDYNPPKRTKRRATLPQEQEVLKHYFKLWTEQGLIDLHSPTRVTPKDYEIVATTLGWDNERVRRWTDHYKQKIKAATEGNP